LPLNTSAKIAVPPGGKGSEHPGLPANGSPGNPKKGIEKGSEVIKMNVNVTQAEMAVGQDGQNQFVVVVLAHGGVELVRGPMGVADARKTTAELMKENFNAVAKQVVVRPLNV
jgi:hypothetical protein